MGAATAHAQLSEGARAGESNLKVRRPVDLREDSPAEEAAVMRLRATLTCEPPNDHLHNFRGRIIIAAEGSHCAPVPSAVRHSAAPCEEPVVVMPLP